MDSLKMELQKVKSDTAKLRIYEALCNECDVENNLTYAKPYLELASLKLQNSIKVDREKKLKHKANALYFIAVYYRNSDSSLYYLQQSSNIYQELNDDLKIERSNK